HAGYGLPLISARHVATSYPRTIASPESRAQVHIAHAHLRVTVTRLAAGTNMEQADRFVLEGNVQRLPSGSVVLRNLRTGDSGAYRCVAVNPTSGHNRTASHVINLKVTPSPQGQSLIANNETVVLECPTAGFSLPSISWTRYGGQLPQDSLQDAYGNLRIPAVSLRDGGTYICQTATGQSLRVSLGVQAPPLVMVPEEEKLVTATAGETVEIACHGGGFPVPNVTWFHDGDRLGEPRILSRSDGHILLLEEVTEADAGIYVCELSNVLGHSSAIIELVIVQEAGGDMSAGSDMGRTAPQGPASNRTSGEIIPIDSDDEDSGGNNRNFKLEVENRNIELVPPSRPTIVQLSDTAVMVSWNVPENAGLPITMFRVQYKEVKPKKGQWQTVDVEIDMNARRHKVSRLKAGGTYKFRIAAVYNNYFHEFSPNSHRFHLEVDSIQEPHPPKVKPRIVEVHPFIYQGIYAIRIRWQYVPVDSSPVKGFYVFYKPFESDGEFEKVTLKGAGITQHTLAELKPDTEYTIKMQSYNHAGASEFSNIVVKRTKPLEGQPPRDMPTPMAPSNEDKTESTTTSRQKAGGLDQPVILGIVLGIMLLLLVVFIAMCWWKQRQQKRRNLNAGHCAKFQDQAQRIYTESLRKKHPNGGPYPPNGLNGLALANGHGPHGQHKMNIDINPMDDMDMDRSQTPISQDPYTGKVYHHGNGVIPNGTLPGYGHGRNSDNNFNSIRHTVSSDNVHGVSGMIPNGIGVHDMGSLSRDRRNGGYNTHHYHPTSHSRSSVSTFTHDAHQRHRAGSLSQSDEGESPDEEDRLTGERSHFSHREKTPPHSSFGQGYGKSYSKSARDRVNRSRDPSPDRLPCYGYEPAPSYDSVSGSGYGSVEGSGFHTRAPVTAPSPASSSHSGKHKRRRKRPHSGREHTTKDQATNTDLSSN
ncbi:hypothetical protein BaRGS_00021188, partial [Batillaria attramentaria]